jgi:hypothetical protein
MTTAKEKCFQEALDKYQDATGKDLGIEHQKDWVKDANGDWAPATFKDHFMKMVNSIRKTFQIQKRLRPPRSPGAPNPVQWRTPDMTVTTPDGNKMVVDTKFTDAKGKIDSWRTKPGMSGSTQKDDYNDINRQQNPGRDDVENLSVDKDNCDCRGKNQPQRVEVVETVTDPSVAPGQDMMPFYVWPAPGGLPPLTAPSPGWVPIPVFP